MKKAITKGVLIISVFILSLLALFSCDGFVEEMNNNDELGSLFIDSIAKNDYSTARSLMRNSASDTDFSAFWNETRKSFEGAKSYNMTNAGFYMNIDNGITTYRTSYKVETDNGSTLLFTVKTAKEFEGIYSVNFYDATDFINDTDRLIPTLNVVFIVISLLAIGFTLWMIIDCVRRNIRRKVLWIILNFIGLLFSFTFNYGGDVNFNFTIGLILRFSNITADIWTASVKASIVLPIGSLIYFLVRKKYTLKPVSEDIRADYANTETDTDCSENTDTYE